MTSKRFFQAQVSALWTRLCASLLLGLMLSANPAAAEAPTTEQPQSPPSGSAQMQPMDTERGCAATAPQTVRSLENCLSQDDFHLAKTVRGQHVDVMVMQGQNFRCMTFDRRNMYQSCMLSAKPTALALEYTRGLLAGMRLLEQPPKNMLLIGMGGGSIPKAVMQHWPNVRLDVVELDRAVVQVAQDWFALQPNAQVQITVQDARVFVRQQIRQGQRYDLIMLDAFDQDYIPEHLLTVEFLQQIRQLLAPGGVVAANTFAQGRLQAHEEATWQAVFPTLWRAKRLMNDILYAAERPLNAPAADALQEAITGVWTDYPTQAVAPSAARVLTDQWSPTNLLRYAGDAH